MVRVLFKIVADTFMSSGNNAKSCATNDTGKNLSSSGRTMAGGGGNGEQTRLLEETDEDDKLESDDCRNYCCLRCWLYRPKSEPEEAGYEVRPIEYRSIDSQRRSSSSSISIDCGVGVGGGGAPTVQLRQENVSVVGSGVRQTPNNYVLTLKNHKENLPPNLVQLLNTSECERWAVGEQHLENHARAEVELERALHNGWTDSAEKRVENACQDKRTSWPLFRESRFSLVPSSIRFVLPEEKVEKPSREIKRMLRWCYNSLIPKVVRKVLYASHFQIASEDSYWVGYWGRHLRTQAFRTILPYQKVNHFPGAFHMGRKDRLWQNIRRMMAKWGDQFNIMPRTFVLPRDSKRLKSVMLASGQLQAMILKPPASARGNGIRIVHRWGQVPNKEPLVAQIYVDSPFLICGSKFDLRLYVYVTSFNPLRVYLYEDGLVRFASIKYSSKLASLSNRMMHLTNFSLNKHATGNEQDRSVTGSKWSLRELWTYLAENGHNVKGLMEKIVDVILKAFISCEAPVNRIIQKHTSFPFVCHELFGFDIVLDENLIPWLLEINISPSLHTTTDLDMAVKSKLARDTLNLAGIQIPDKRYVHDISNRFSLELIEPSSKNCCDFRVKQIDTALTTEEKTKQAYHIRRFTETEKTDPSIFDSMTPSDLRVLIETEDEYDRRGQFARIFPSPTSGKYLKYFDHPKYYNLLVQEWMEQYSHIRAAGCAYLESLSKQGYHLRKSSS